MKWANLWDLYFPSDIGDALLLPLPQGKRRGQETRLSHLPTFPPEGELVVWSMVHGCGQGTLFLHLCFHLCILVARGRGDQGLSWGGD